MSYPVKYRKWTIKYYKKENYEKLNELANNRTVILVTHRLGAVRSTSKIIVLDNGSIAGLGNFEQLMGQKGYFYHIWDEQAKWYQDT